MAYRQINNPLSRKSSPLNSHGEKDKVLTAEIEAMKKEIEDEGGGEDDMMMSHDPTISEDKND